MAKPQYPRAVPFKAPEETGESVAGAPPSPLPAGPPAEIDSSLGARLLEAQERTARLWRWTLIVAVSTVAVVVVAAVVGVSVVAQALSRDENLRTAVQPQQPETKVEVRRTTAVAQTKSDTPPEALPAPVALPKPVAPVRPDPAAAREPALEAVGGLTASHLYQSYLNLGLLADATENDVYSESEGLKLLSTMLSMMDVVDGQLARVIEAATDEEDQKRLTQVRELAALLRTQGMELRAYWETPEKEAAIKKEHETKFHRAREQAWTGIKALLALKDDDDDK